MKTEECTSEQVSSDRRSCSACGRCAATSGAPRMLQSLLSGAVVAGLSFISFWTTEKNSAELNHCGAPAFARPRDDLSSDTDVLNTNASLSCSALAFRCTALRSAPACSRSLQARTPEPHGTSIIMTLTTVMRW